MESLFIVENEDGLERVLYNALRRSRNNSLNIFTVYRIGERYLEREGFIGDKESEVRICLNGLVRSGDLEYFKPLPDPRRFDSRMGVEKRVRIATASQRAYTDE